MAEPLPWCHLDGAVMPLADARISPLDRGFLYADGVYEVVPVHRGRPFRFVEHIARLEHSLAATGIANPHDRDGWRALFRELLARNGAAELYVYLQVTRGAEFGRNHAPPRDLEPTVFAFCAPLPPADPRLLADGLACITAGDTRWARCDIKSVALLANVLLRGAAVERGAQETILIREGWLTEASSSAVHVVLDDTLLAPPQTQAILAGTTRAVVEELAQAAGLRCIARPISEAELRGADEVWLSAAVRGLASVTRLDGHAVGTGTPGPWFRRLHADFATLIGGLADTPW
ncbi:MAG: aminotransferase class IV [Steroidobacteraceae bacterium]